MKDDCKEQHNDLSIDDRIAVAWSEFCCTGGATNKRVKWREYARLVKEKKDAEGDDRDLQKVRSLEIHS